MSSVSPTVYIDDFQTDDKFECKDRTSSPRFPDESDYVMRWETEDYVHRHLKVFPYTPMRSLRISQGRSRYIGCNRRIARCVSDDFVHWSLPEVVIRPDELDPPRLYNMDVTIPGTWAATMSRPPLQARSTPSAWRDCPADDWSLARPGMSWAS